MKVRKGLDKKSQASWEKAWKTALKTGVCPIAGCDIRTGTCEHLDRHLTYDSKVPVRRPKFMLVDDYEDRATGAPVQPGQVWKFYKQLKAWECSRDEIRVLVRKFGYNMTLREIEIDLGYTSTATLFRFYRQAVAKLRRLLSDE